MVCLFNNINIMNCKISSNTVEIAGSLHVLTYRTVYCREDMRQAWLGVEYFRVHCGMVCSYATVPFSSYIPVCICLHDKCPTYKMYLTPKDPIHKCPNTQMPYIAPKTCKWASRLDNKDSILFKRRYNLYSSCYNLMRRYLPIAY